MSADRTFSYARQAIGRSDMKVFLRGGPALLSQNERIRDYVDMPRVIKVKLCGGYERFESTGERSNVDGEPAHVYRWTYRTEIGE